MCFDCAKRRVQELLQTLNVDPNNLFGISFCCVEHEDHIHIRLCTSTDRTEWVVVNCAVSDFLSFLPQRVPVHMHYQNEWSGMHGSGSAAQHQLPRLTPASDRIVHILKFLSTRQHKCRSHHEASYDDTCPICIDCLYGGSDDADMEMDTEGDASMSPMNSGRISTQFIELPCGHRFHTGCLLTWVSRSNTCPTCRLSLQEDNMAKHAVQYLNHEEKSVMDQRYMERSTRLRAQQQAI